MSLHSYILLDIYFVIRFFLTKYFVIRCRFITLYTFLIQQVYHEQDKGGLRVLQHNFWLLEMD